MNHKGTRRKNVISEKEAVLCAGAHSTAKAWNLSPEEETSTERVVEQHYKTSSSYLRDTCSYCSFSKNGAFQNMFRRKLSWKAAVSLYVFQKTRAGRTYYINLLFCGHWQIIPYYILLSSLSTMVLNDSSAWTSITSLGKLTYSTV